MAKHRAGAANAERPGRMKTRETKGAGGAEQGPEGKAEGGASIINTR